MCDYFLMASWGSALRDGLMVFLFVEVYCVFTTAPWSRGGSGARWSAYIHPRLVWSQVCGSCSRRLGV